MNLTSYPPNIGLICVGQINGSASVCHVKDSSFSTLRLRPKQVRPCNAVAFNTNGLLAIGLDKVRNDACLHVWDVHHYGSSTGNKEQPNKTPAYTFLPSEVVSSLCFFPQRPDSLLCGSYKFLRELDMRSQTATLQCATKCVLGISVDPFDENYFSSYSEDGSLAIWDRRMVRVGTTASADPTLFINRLFGDGSRKSPLSCFRYSSTRPHEFASITDGNLLRRWQMGVQMSYLESENHALSRSSSSRVMASLTSTTSLNDINASNNIGQNVIPTADKRSNLFISSVLDAQTDLDRVVSFDYVLDLSNDRTANFICIRQSGQVFRMKVIESPDAITFDPNNNIAIVDPERITITSGAMVDSPHPSTKIQIAPSFAPVSSQPAVNLGRDRRKSMASAASGYYDNEDESETESDYSNRSHHHLDHLFDPADIIDRDISTTIKKRTEAGYSFDCEANRSLFAVSSNTNQDYLRYTWNWIYLAQRSAIKGSMLAGSLDLGFEGVLGIWSGSSDLEFQKRQMQGKVVSDTDFIKAVMDILQRSNNSIFTSPDIHGTKIAQRQLCLKVAGWNFALSQLEEKLVELETQGKHEQAAGWAVFHGDVSRAVKSLAASKKERLRLMSTAVAGYLAYKDSSVNSAWREQCRKLASDLDNPYLRAIFAFISDGDWLDVLDEGSLPFHERLGIALRFLPDEEVSSYLNRMAEKAVAHGELEGVILTGITPKAVDLLQSYVDKTADVQTASLIISFGCPRYFEDERVGHWIDNWRFFKQRAAFDVAKSQLSTNSLGVKTFKPVPRQIYLRCSHCKKTIGVAASRATDVGGYGKSSLIRSQNAEPMTRCSGCNNPLPRCAVCLLPLGSPGIPRLGRSESHFDRWFSYCLSCNHGSHAEHARQWFEKHNICPIPDCNCYCNSK